MATWINEAMYTSLAWMLYDAIRPAGNPYETWDARYSKAHELAGRIGRRFGRRMLASQRRALIAAARATKPKTANELATVTSTVAWQLYYGTLDALEAQRSTNYRRRT
jgi:hypothetical protein